MTTPAATDSPPHPVTPSRRHPLAPSPPHPVTPSRRHPLTPSPPHAAETSPLAALSTEGSTRGPEFFRTVARLGIQAAEALEHAHGMGVVHRDIKPSNLLLDAGGHLWLTDFGLAMTHTETNLTMTGDLIGTLRYMSPEQIEAKHGVLDHRTDVYSLGLTLYELLTLQPAFGGDDRQKLLRQIPEEDPRPPRQINKAIPKDLETIVLKAMRKNPEERYATAGELADDLQRFLEQKPIEAKRPTLVDRIAKWARRHRTVVWSAAVILLLATMSLGVSNLLISQEHTRTTQALEEKEKALAAASANLRTANEERERAEANFLLAMRALDEVYLKSIGEEKLLGVEIEAPPGANQSAGQKPAFSELERKLLQRGLAFYDQFAQQNRENPQALFETGKAFYRVALLHVALDENDEAQEAYTEAISRLKALTEQYRTKPEHFLELGRVYFGQGQLSRWWPDARNTFAEAEHALSRTIELDPKDARSYALRGQAYVKMAQEARAVDDFLRAAELDPDNAYRHSTLAGFFQYVLDPGLRDGSRSLQHAKKAAELAPRNAYTRAYLGRIYWEVLNDRNLALEELDKAIELNPNLAGAYFDRSFVYQSIDLPRALEEIDKALQLDPESARYASRRADLYVQLGRFEEALDDYENAERDDGNYFRIYWGRGGLYLKLREYEAALDDFNKLLELAPSYSYAYKRRGLVHFHLAHYDEALADIDRAVALNPDDASNLSWISPALVAVCPDEEFKKGMLALADKMIELTNGSGNAYGARGFLYADLNQLDKARADFERAVGGASSYYARYPSALCCLEDQDRQGYRKACADMLQQFAESSNTGQFHYAAWSCVLAPDAVDDYSKVIELARRAVEVDSSFAHRQCLGAVLYRAGRFTDAIETLTSIADSEDSDSETTLSAYSWHFLAMAHHAAGDSEKADQWLKKAVAWTDKALEEHENKDGARLSWNRRLTLKLFRAEAEALLGIEEPSTPEEKEEPHAKARRRQE